MLLEAVIILCKGLLGGYNVSLFLCSELYILLGYKKLLLRISGYYVY